MKRRLIGYDVFERIEKDSLSSAQHELTEAENVMARSLGLPNAELRCFGVEDVIYESVDGSFVHANYQLKNGHIVFENIEQLVIDEDTEIQKSREILSDLVESLLVDETEKADQLFESYVNLPLTRRTFNEGSTIVRRREERKMGPDGKLHGTGKYKKVKERSHGTKESSSDTNKRVRGRIKSQKKIGPGAKKTKASHRAIIKLPGEKRMVKEWFNLCEGVFNYLDYKEYGPVVNESVASHDERGNVVTLKVPNMELRNESKLKEFDWKTLNTDVIIKRNGAKTLGEDSNFWKAISDLKRQNALSDNDTLIETLENIASAWPQALYLTETELSEIIKNSLEAVNATNYDDQTCDFMAEGILRTLHDNYVDRVNKILTLSGASLQENVEDKYSFFKNVVSDYFPYLDENTQMEMQVFVDLYEAIRNVHVLAGDKQEGMLQAEAATHLNELLSIIQQEIEPSSEAATSAAEWLWSLVETNLDSKDWNVSNTPHVTVSGDHPDMAKKAQQGYAPASDFTGDWGDSAPVSDGDSYKGGLADEMRNRSWGNWSNDGVYPSLNNPYILKPFGDYKISGEKHIDTDSGQLAHWGDESTWPNLQNPYVPKAETPQTYKMNKGKEDDLVIDQ